MKEMTVRIPTLQFEFLGRPRKVKPIKFDKSRPVDEIQKIDFVDLNSLPSDVVFKGYAKNH